MASLRNRYRKRSAALLAAGMIVSLAACGSAQKSLSVQPSAENAKVDTVESDPDNETGVNEVDLDFSVFDNVEITGINTSELSADEQAVLYQQARYCQAMTEADTETMTGITSPDMIFTHMSGRQQTREEYFADIADGNLQYFTIGIENPVVNTNGSYASVSYTSVLNANAYGAKGVYRIDGTHWYEKHGENWVACNPPKQERDR